MLIPIFPQGVSKRNGSVPVLAQITSLPKGCTFLYDPKIFPFGSIATAELYTFKDHCQFFLDIHILHKYHSLLLFLLLS